MAKRLADTEALSTQAVNDLSEEEKIIQEQAKQIEEKEKQGKKILAATKKPEGERAVSG